MVLSGTSPAFTKQSRLGFEIEERPSGSSPVRLSHLLSLAVIIIYTKFLCLSIDNMHIIPVFILSILYTCFMCLSVLY